LTRIAAIDFETTGMSPAHGARATEIGLVVLEEGRIVRRFQSLMNAGVWVPPFIEQLTGISNRMLRTAPPADEVMEAAAEFVGDTPLLAHNASFDCKFWDDELTRVGRARQQAFACSMLLSRRLLPDAPNHKLGTLTAWAGLPGTGRAHRALADAEMAANLVVFLCGELRRRHGLEDVSHDLLCRLQRTPAAQLTRLLARECGSDIADAALPMRGRSLRPSRRYRA
jgi:DNA polymerase-3 subunit epsilon